jgi:hypothetical protein
MVVLFGAMATVSVAIFFAGTAVPETAADPLIFHLALPGRFALEHRIVPVPEMFHGSLPMGAPMHYGWMILLGGESAVRAWRGWVLVALLLLIYRLAAREGYRSAGWIAAGIFATLPQTHWMGATTFVDMEACALGLVACLAMRAAGRRRTGLGGMLAGAACAVKLTSVFLLPGLVVAAGRKTPRWIARRAIVTGLAVAAVLAPWWVRNEILVGNPVYPFAGAVFPAFRPMPAANRALLARHTESRVLWRAGEWPVFPWRSAKGMNEETRLGPVFLLAVPWLVLRPPVGAFAAYAWVAGLGFVGWAAATHIPRYGMIVWALLAVLVAVSLSVAGKRRWQAALCAVMLAAFGLDVAGRSLPAAAGLLPVWLGRVPTSAALEGLPNPYMRIARAAAGLPRNARVLLVGDLRGAHWPVPVVNQSPYDVQVSDEILSSSWTPAEAAKRFRQHAGWVYVNDAESGRMKYTRAFPILVLDSRAERVAAGVWRDWMDEAGRSGGGVLWRVRRVPRRYGPFPAVPLTFREAALRKAYGPLTTLSFGVPGGGTTTIRIPK